MVKKAIVILLALGIVGQASAHARDFLARFEGGIGVIPVADAAGPVNADGTFSNVKLNVVRGVSPAGPWRIADLRSDVDADGRIRIRGRGLLLANGNSIGQNANQRVFATVFCEAAAPFRRTQHRLRGCAARTEWRFSHRRHAESGAVGMRKPGASDSQQR